MKVCMLSYSFYESDNRVMRYAEALAQRGDHVDVIALRRPGQTRREALNGVNVIRIQQRIPDEKSRAAYLAKLSLFLMRAGCLLSWKHLRSRYHLVHVHSVPDYLVFAAFLPRLTGAKIILDIHDLLPEFYASKFQSEQNSPVYRLLLWVERISAAFAHRVIIANDVWRKKLVARSVPDFKCAAILNYPDFRLFRPNGRARNDGKFVMMFPGTLSWHQGVDIAIRAFARIRDAAPNAEFHIYGEGRVQSSLRTLVKELGLQERVLFKPVQPLREIAAVMENADLGVVPKRKDSFGDEAFSTKILEFMALGVPVIVSDSTVDRYYFNDSVVQFFRGGDEEDLARCILRLIREPELRQHLVRNASDFVQNYDWERKKGEYLKLVDSLVKTTICS
jgi:glycosyltransferase involved in cell wall biosynthesis